MEESMERGLRELREERNMRFGTRRDTMLPLLLTGFMPTV